MISAVIITVGVGIIGFFSNLTTNDNFNNQNLFGNWMDVHGLGFIPAETVNGSGTIYIATHNGLFKKNSTNNNSSQWEIVGNDESDMMGFTIHPNKQGVMYSSGHPPTGGNLGFRISNDYGVTWQKVSNVTSLIPIDFHTITIGSYPEIIYGASSIGDTLLISTDSGKKWNTVKSPDGERIVTLATNQTDSLIVYAATTNGLYSSSDQGTTWQKKNKVLPGNQSQSSNMVTGIEISSDGKTLYSFVAPKQDSNNGDESGYIIKSTDGAKTWTKTEGQINGVQFVSKFVFGNNNDVYVALIQDIENIGVSSSVYSSNNGGKSWKLEGTNNNKLLASTL